jgi:hypothetical protein
VAGRGHVQVWERVWEKSIPHQKRRRAARGGPCFFEREKRSETACKTGRSLTRIPRFSRRIDKATVAARAIAHHRATSRRATGGQQLPTAMGVRFAVLCRVAPSEISS